MELRSSAYRPGGAIPDRYTCDGDNLSPDFRWSGIPPATKSLALVLHDPDAPREDGFTHWVVYDLDPGIHNIDESAPKQVQVTEFGIQGKNDAGTLGYIGPCPTAGKHRYIARLYCLDVELDLRPGATRQELEAAMQGHILDQAALTGTYARKANESSGHPRAAA
jgi:Raf kinase inhibitor-like YbhB/YbcL family protein